MLDQLTNQGILRKSSDGNFELADPARIIQPASVGYFDALDKWGNTWSASGWAVDPETKKSCIYAFPVQNGRIAGDVVFRKAARPDVNAFLNLDARHVTGFTISFSSELNGPSITLIVVLPSGALVILPGPGRESPQYTETVLTEVTNLGEEWKRLCSHPLYAFPPDSPFRGIYSFDRSFNPRHTAGVSDQFLAEAATYHRKYTEHPRWKFLITQAFSQIRLETGDQRQLSVLDIGSGSGNSVIPLLQMLPDSKLIATDISPQLLAILRDGIDNSDLSRLLIIAMDAAQRNFSAGAFDLIVGAAILHHIIDPSHTLAACHHSLKSGGYAIFYEAFEQGYVLLRLLYEQLLERQRELNLTEEVAGVLRAIVLDVDIRTGSDKSSDVYEQVDDKWLFTRTYFEQQKERLGFSELQIYPLDVSTSRFSNQLRTHLKLCLGAGVEAVGPQAWDFIQSFERKMSSEAYSELLFEACIILKK